MRATHPSTRLGNCDNITASKIAAENKDVLPKLRSNNHEDVKFCKRCGTNLGVVSEALTGKIAGKPAADDRMAKLTRDYYRGRRDTITGAVLIPAGLLVMAIMMAAGMKPIGAFFIICWMFFWGAAALAGGLGKWIASNSELKSLGYGSQSPVQGQSFREGPLADQTALPPGSYSTGPVGYPGSVTEQTTRQLDERGRASLRREQDSSPVDGK